MKVRTGFVSNSSSSSFVILIKGELTKRNFLKLMMVEDHPFRSGVESLFDYMVQQKYSHFVRSEEDFKKFLRQKGWADLDPEEYYTKTALQYKTLLDRGYSFITSSLSNNEDQEEMDFGGFLTTISTHDNIEDIKGTEDFIIIKEW